jgi:hypothetical protein
MKTVIPALIFALAAQAQTFTAEFDPDFYFDRGITLALGAKLSAESRWTFLGDFASRKIGPLRDDTRLQWRFGGGTRLRLFGERNNVFVQLNVSADQLRRKSVTYRGASARPGIGAQWFPWKTRGFYAAPLLAMENPPGPSASKPRLELRVGWQF